MLVNDIIPLNQLIDYITRNEGCTLTEIQEHFKLRDKKTLSQRLNRMKERGEIRLVFGAHGSRRFYPIVKGYETIKTLYNPMYERTVKSVFECV